MGASSYLPHYPQSTRCGFGVCFCVVVLCVLCCVCCAVCVVQCECICVVCYYPCYYPYAAWQQYTHTLLSPPNPIKPRTTHPTRSLSRTPTHLDTYTHPHSPTHTYMHLQTPTRTYTHTQTPTQAASQQHEFEFTSFDNQICLSLVGAMRIAGVFFFLEAFATLLFGMWWWCCMLFVMFVCIITHTHFPPPQTHSTCIPALTQAHQWPPPGNGRHLQRSLC